MPASWKGWRRWRRSGIMGCSGSRLPFFLCGPGRRTFAKLYSDDVSFRPGSDRASMTLDEVLNLEQANGKRTSFPFRFDGAWLNPNARGPSNRQMLEDRGVAVFDGPRRMEAVVGGSSLHTRARLFAGLLELSVGNNAEHS